MYNREQVLFKKIIYALKVERLYVLFSELVPTCNIMVEEGFSIHGVRLAAMFP